MNQKVLLDNSVITVGFMAKIKELRDKYDFFITARTNAKNDYGKTNPWLKIIGEPARLDHTILGSGEVWGSSESKGLTNKLLSIAASQRSIQPGRIGHQTTYNQRDDADIVACAVINEVPFLISNDKKFMLRKEILDFVKQYDLKILNPTDFLKI